MTEQEIIKRVENGEKFFINLEKRTLRIANHLVDLKEVEMPEYDGDVLKEIERRYRIYKHSVPSERSESHRRRYFKALPESKLSDEAMMYGEQREVARCSLELFVLMAIVRGILTWHEEWGSWFWQSPADKDLILFRQWIGAE